MTEPNGPVVVGISRRTGSPDALDFAMDEARRRRTTVLAVTAWRPPRPPGAPGGRPVGFPPVTPGDVWSQERQRMAALIDERVGDGNDDVTFELRRGQPAAVLIEAARGACLLVLDSPRAGNLTTVPKSWIAPAIIFRAGCPVVVLPGRRGTRLRDRLLTAAGTAGRPGIQKHLSVD